MSEAKFTKGEWFIEKDANWNDDYWAISVKRNYDDSIHHCFAEVVYKMEHEDSNPELEANAHLIAAAPEMYAMLEKVLTEYKEMFGMSQEVKDIEQLLAKARGEHA